jgi:nucleoside-diphosphate-sugar epimerase
MSMSDERAVVLGAGPVGMALVQRLAVDGVEIRVVTRSGRASVPEGVEVVAADISDSEQAGLRSQ